MKSAFGQSGRLAQIDVLRGLAAAWVMLSHYLPHWDDRLGGAFVIVPNDWGKHAVELFFVISGFVVFMTLDKCRNVLDFAVLRFSRLYPVYWTSLAGVALILVLVFHAEVWPAGLLVNLTMLQEFLGWPHFDNVYWSLSVELAFYLNAALWFQLGIHRNVRWIVATWLVAALAWALLLGDAAADQRDWFARVFALDYAPYFAVGMLFHEAGKRGWSLQSMALIGLAILTELALDGWAAAFVAAFIVTVFALAVRGHLKLLVSRVTVGLGTISYSLYLVHRNLGYGVLDWMHGHGIPVGIAVPVTIAGAVAIAVALTWYVEQPAIHWIRLRYERWKSAHPPRAVSTRPRA
jgi:peptidoglycan/LPS O-acetylase OafA/YrhL